MAKGSLTGCAAASTRTGWETPSGARPVVVHLGQEHEGLACRWGSPPRSASRPAAPPTACGLARGKLLRQVDVSKRLFAGVVQAQCKAHHAAATGRIGVDLRGQRDPGAVFGSLHGDGQRVRPGGDRRAALGSVPETVRRKVVESRITTDWVTSYRSPGLREKGVGLFQLRAGLIRRRGSFSQAKSDALYSASRSVTDSPLWTAAESAESTASRRWSVTWMGVAPSSRRMGSSGSALL